MSTTRSAPKVQKSGNVKIITFTEGNARDVDNVLGEELRGLSDDLGDCHLLLDFVNVDFLSSIELGTLVTLHNKMKASGGRLTLFNLSDQVFEVFETTCLHRLLTICREEREAS